MTDEQTLFIRMGLTALRTAHQILDQQMKTVRTLDDAKPHLPHRLFRLLEVLKWEGKQIEKLKRENAAALAANNEEVNKKLEPAEFSGIIFVEQRYIAYVMRVNQLRTFLKVVTRSRNVLKQSLRESERKFSSFRFP